MRQHGAARLVSLLRKQTKNNNSDISYKQPCECDCTEIGRVRRIAKNRLTGLSFTTGLVIRISHDEERGSTQPEAFH